MAAGTSASRGRSTRTFRRVRKATLDYSTVCVVCGHDGADSVDHLVARALDPAQAEDPDNLAPCHHEPCPVCSQRCNRVKGTRPLADVVQLKTSRDWFAA